jgi:TolA-binding protein
MVTQDQLAELYVALFQRAPTQQELEEWYQVEKDKTLAEAGADMLYAAAQVVESDPTAQQLYPEYANLDSGELSEEQIEQVINAVYQVLFGKDAQTDPEGVKGWVKHALENGGDLHALGETIASITYVGNLFADGEIQPEDPETLNAAMAFKHKVQVALEAAQQIQQFDGDFETLHKLIEEVDHTEDSLKKVQEQLQVIAEVKNQHHNQEEHHSTDEDDVNGDGDKDGSGTGEDVNSEETFDNSTPVDNGENVEYPEEDEDGTASTSEDQTPPPSNDGTAEGEEENSDETSQYYISEDTAATDTSNTSSDTDSTDTTHDTTHEVHHG